MYTNELLEEKYKAQKELAKKALTTKEDYFKVVAQEVQDLFKLNNWNVQLDKRKGAYLSNAR